GDRRRSESQIIDVFPPVRIWAARGTRYRRLRLVRRDQESDIAVLIDRASRNELRAHDGERRRVLTGGLIAALVGARGADVSLCAESDKDIAIAQARQRTAGGEP